MCRALGVLAAGARRFKNRHFQGSLRQRFGRKNQTSPILDPPPISSLISIPSAALTPRRSARKVIIEND